MNQRISPHLTTSPSLSLCLTQSPVAVCTKVEPDGGRLADVLRCAISISGFVRPVSIRSEFHVRALVMLPCVAENAPRTTFNLSAQSLQPFHAVLSWFLHPRGELISCCTGVRTVLRHVDCERGPAARQSCGALRQNLQLSLRLLPVVILEVLCSPVRDHGACTSPCRCISTVPEHASRCSRIPDSTPANV